MEQGGAVRRSAGAEVGAMSTCGAGRARRAVRHGRCGPPRAVRAAGGGAVRRGRCGPMRVGFAYAMTIKLTETICMSMWYMGKGTGCLSRLVISLPASRNDSAYFSSSRMSAPLTVSGLAH